MGKISYSIELEIYEGDGCDFHKKGEKYTYPEDMGRMCPWLSDSVGGMVRVLQFGGTLPWTYAGTSYEKQIGEESATEFVRCPDPTSAGVVVKITRRKLEKPVDVGWA